MSKEELLKEKHVSIDIINERERLEKMLKILQIHKRYENEKYFGGGGMLKRNHNQLAVTTTLNTAGITQNPDYVGFSTDVLFQKQKGGHKEDKNPNDH